MKNNISPAWWCREIPYPAIGPDVTGYTNSIPAKRRFDGLPCTHPGDLTLRGVPADRAIYLITGLPPATRAFTLSGLTNYTPYTITLRAMSNSAAILSDTLTVMPAARILHLPVVIKGQ